MVSLPLSKYYIIIILFKICGIKMIKSIKVASYTVIKLLSSLDRVCFYLFT